MLRNVFIMLFAIGSLNGLAQTVQGSVKDSAGNAIAYATVALLDPSDSNLLFYGISNVSGEFVIRAVKDGSFLLQAGCMGYHTFYKPILVGPGASPNLGSLIMRAKSNQLQEVEVSSEKLPLLLKGDTVEYNAGAFKTRPDASVEELLKKLPGVQVDRAGNIKAQGEQVNKVLVDGKEFFGNDPKVATKNLPADAINKVQVFNKKSDQAVFTGIDDGQRDKTINLELKDGKKVGYFGDLQAGVGTDDKYKLSGKLYRFRKESQVAFLGMLNNTNEFGFTMEDYLNFKGGMRGLMNGNGDVNISVNSRDNLPVNFGQTVTGLITSGAGGFNLTYEPKESKRFNISYLGNGSSKDLDEQVHSINFTPTGTFDQSSHTGERSENWAHRLNISLRNEMDSALQILLNGSASLVRDDLNRKLSSATFIKDRAFSSLESMLDDNGSGIEADANLSLVKKSRSRWPALKLSGGADYTGGLTKTEWNNLLRLTDTSSPTFDWQYQHNRDQKMSYNAGASIVRYLSNGYYVEPEIYWGQDQDHLAIEQKDKVLNDALIDSLSPDFRRTYTYWRPGISFKRATKDEQLRLAIKYESGDLSAGGTSHYTKGYWLPSAQWRRQLGRGKNLELVYNTSIQLPAAQQMVPVANNTDPLNRFQGNRGLAPEYRHQINAHGLWFDEFSFTSLFISARVNYTRDKINWARRIHEDLSQDVTLINVKDDLLSEGTVEFSTPIRKLGITLELSLDEKYNSGYNRVDDLMNKTSSFTHGLSIKGNNRKKVKWDIAAGGSVELTTAKYSVRTDLNNKFYNLGYFADISFTPTSKWHFDLNADVNQYISESFGNPVTVPLLKAGITYSCLKYNRGSIILEGYDLLNRNTGLERVSEFNYLQERRSSIIGRYVMLSFKYRLNRAGGKASGNTITIGK